MAGVVIPKRLFQTISDKRIIPEKVWNNIRTFAADYEHFVFDDAECEAFFKQYYNDEILQLFRGYKNGAHKADLFRYCVLYIHGGVYLDIKTELIMPLSDIFQDGKPLYTVITENTKRVYNGIIAAIPRHEIFAVLIRHMLENGPNLWPWQYFKFCKDFYQELQTRNPNNHMLFIETLSRNANDCSDRKLDQYGWCSNIVHPTTRKKLFKTRYSDYPWNALPASKPSGIVIVAAVFFIFGMIIIWRKK